MRNMKFVVQVSIWLFCLVNIGRCLEVGVPERFLRPRNFNPHPYLLEEASLLQASGGDYASSAAASQRDLSDLPHPYRFFERTSVRGEPTNSGAPVQFPKVPEESQVQPQEEEPRSRLKPENVRHPLNINENNDVQIDRIPVQSFPAHYEYEVPRTSYATAAPPSQSYTSAVTPQPLALGYDGPRYSSSPKFTPHHQHFRGEAFAPKNYAFSYAVRDGHSGDDFSHSQAHSGAQTKGEYRVKLPDGRVQVVSYTADDSGYKADVRYDHENAVEPIITAPVVKYKAPQHKTVFKPAAFKTAYKTVYVDQLDLSPTPDYKPIHEPTQEPQLYHRQQSTVTESASGFLSVTPAPAAQAGHSTPSPQTSYIDAESHDLSSNYVSSTPGPDDAYNVDPKYFISASPAPQGVEHDGEGGLKPSYFLIHA